MERCDSQPLDWAVVGAGPCGILAVALLVEDLKLQERLAAAEGLISETAAHRKIVWIDPCFRVGNLPRWRDVQANSSVQAICSSFEAIPSLGFHSSQKARGNRGFRTLSSLISDDNGVREKKIWCELGLVVDALEDATAALLQDSHVVGIRGQVASVTQHGAYSLRSWQIDFIASARFPEAEEEGQADGEDRHRGLIASLRTIEPERHITMDLAQPVQSPVYVRSVALVTGASPRVPPFRLQQKVHTVDLDRALVSAELRTLFRWSDPPCCIDGVSNSTWQELRWTVVGSSHSAMLVVRNLIGLGVRKVSVVHRRPLVYVEPQNSDGNAWLKNIGTGLLGPTAAWCRKELPLLEHGRIIWKRFSDEGGVDARSSQKHADVPSDHWQDWVLRHSDVLVFAAGFETSLLPSISAEEPDVERPSREGSSRALHASHLSRQGRSRSPRATDCRDPRPRLRSLPSATGLVGLGIGFPEHHVEPDGDVDIRVGFVRHYMEHAARTLGVSAGCLIFDEAKHK